MISKESDQQEQQAPLDISQRKEALEQRYIQLLEQRIASLESSLGQSNTQSPPTIELPVGDVGPKDAVVNGENGKDKEKEKDQTNQSTQEKPGRIRKIKKKWDAKCLDWVDTEDDSAPTVTEEKGPGKPATFRQHIDMNNEKIEYEEIEIHSEALQHLVIKTDDWWKEHTAERSQPIIEESPFFGFVWNWPRYVEACKPMEEDNPAMAEARTDLGAVMECLKNSDSLKSYFRLRDSIMTTRKIKYDFLWTLFPHGSKVYARSYKRMLQMFEVVGHKTPDPGEFWLTCSAYDWDGTQFSTYTYNFLIKKFPGEKFINSLDVFPIGFLGDSEENEATRVALLARGRRYFEICTGEPSSFQYTYQGTDIDTINGVHKLTTSWSGMNTQSNEDIDNAETPPPPKDRTARGTPVIIDHYSYLNSLTNRGNKDSWKKHEHPPLGKEEPGIQPACECSVCSRASHLHWSPGSDDSDKAFSDKEDRLLLLPPRLLGFSLRDKVWGQFAIDKVEDKTTGADETVFEHELQLEESSKLLLRAYVKRHTLEQSPQYSIQAQSKRNKAFDAIEGKGQGVAIMLHGPTGVGKTLTAEAIALATNRPLFPVSVAEIGTKPHNVEENLQNVFRIATRWEAVLLIDEADVFVEERSKQDLARNALVSVMLRCLEYFEGIIILTTNRIKSIDPAVQSRISLAIQYRDLTQEQKLNIYKNRLRFVPDEEIGDRRALETQLSRSPLIKQNNKVNGRQIRNIITGARHLAKSEGVTLSLGHLQTVGATTTDFINGLLLMTQRSRMRNEVDFDDL